MRFIKFNKSLKMTLIKILWLSVSGCWQRLLQVPDRRIARGQQDFSRNQRNARGSARFCQKEKRTDTRSGKWYSALQIRGERTSGMIVPTKCSDFCLFLDIFVVPFLISFLRKQLQINVDYNLAHCLHDKLCLGFPSLVKGPFHIWTLAKYFSQSQHFSRLMYNLFSITWVSFTHISIL